MSERMNEPSQHLLPPAGPCPQRPAQEGTQKGEFSGSLCPLAQIQPPFPCGVPADWLLEAGRDPREMGSSLMLLLQLCACVTPEQATLTVSAVSCLPFLHPHRSLRNRLLPAPEPEDSGGEEHPEPHLGPDTHLL